MGNPEQLKYSAEVLVEVETRRHVGRRGIETTYLLGVLEHDRRCQGGVGAWRHCGLKRPNRDGGKTRQRQRQARVVWTAADGVVHESAKRLHVCRKQAQSGQRNRGEYRVWMALLSALDNKLHKVVAPRVQDDGAQLVVRREHGRTAGQASPDCCDFAIHGSELSDLGVTNMLYFRQLKGGRDFAAGDRVATMMDNFVYLIGDSETGEAVAVDPAWDIDGLLNVAAADGMRVVGALCSHWHPDHVGGPMYGHDVQGIALLLERTSGCRVWVHREDAAWVAELTGVAPSALTLVDHGTEISVGSVQIECLHTPGHTKGSQCFRCRNALISGDTVFLQGCGRVDLPGGDVDEMYRTLTERLAALPGDLVLYPGHDYGNKPSAPLAEVRRSNPLMGANSYEAFRALRG